MTIASTARPDLAADRPMTAEERKVIFASSLGTAFEWYDFYLYGSLAAVIAKQFFAGLNDTAAFLAALLAFAAGFIVRPFGALVFGRIGDLVGRKYTFLVTITLMGLSTFIVGFLPGYGTIGVAAPAILILLRIVQGLALGGEYGGAATYVAEHAPHHRRGLYTGWIQTTATGGLLLSLVVILACRLGLSEAAFNDWGWRIPFLVSVLLLATSVWIRLQLSESPAFLRMREEGTHSRAPLTEAFGQWRYAKVALLALLGLVMGEAVIWYGGQFYAQIFLTRTLHIDDTTATVLLALALLIGTPFYVVFGWLSDRIGRKPIILGGCLIAALAYFPIFQGLTHYANPALERAIASAQVTVVADPADCSVQFDPVGKAQFTSSCDIAKGLLGRNAVAYANEAAPAGTPASIRIAGTTIPSYAATGLDKATAASRLAAFQGQVFQGLRTAGYPVAEKTVAGATTYAIAPADTAAMNKPMVVVMLLCLVLLVTLVYGPIAAALVELFPTRIRYTGMSLPYHIGNGWFGGLLPFIAAAMTIAKGDIYYGLWFPVVVAALTVVIGVFLVPETKDRDIHAID